MSETGKGFILQLSITRIKLIFYSMLYPINGWIDGIPVLCFHDHRKAFYWLNVKHVTPSKKKFEKIPTKERKIGNICHCDYIDLCS